MPRLELTDRELVVHLTAWESIWSLRGSFRVPLAQVRGATEDGGFGGRALGLRIPGTYFPGLIAAGTFIKGSDKQFVYTSRKLQTIVIELAGNDWARLVIGVPNARAEAARINAAGPASTSIRHRIHHHSAWTAAMHIPLLERNKYMLINLRLRLGITLWLLAMVGVVVLATAVIPQVLARSQQQVPLSIVVIASIVQSGVLLLLAVWAGVTFSRRLGLGAPVIEAALSRSGPWLVLRDQFIPAAIVGVAIGCVLLVAQRMSPAELLTAGQTITFPLAAKVLYGGIVEEVLLRWGLMTTLIWLPWRFAQKMAGPPRISYVIGAIILAAVLFGAGHLPAAAALMGGSLTGPVVVFVLIGNSVPGVMFGYLYWRYGIEAAMMAHALAHVLFFLATGA